MMHNMAMKEVKTLVWWNINSCPIPPGYDPRQVGPRIVSVLKKHSNFFSGTVTITAIGRLTHSPSSPGNDVLRELSSTGIALIHAHDLETDLFEWIKKNPSPANIMIISGPTELEGLARTIYRLQYGKGYHIFLAYPQRDQLPAWLWKSFLLRVFKEWLWTSLLADDMDSGSADNKQVTTSLVLQETGKSPWSCSICHFAGQSFEDFTTHLNSEEHAHFVLDDLVVDAPKDNPRLHQLKEEEEEVKTLVWWCINGCPIPPGYDPRQVGPRIVSALMNSRVSGPVTITAIGRLTHTPSAPDNDVLRELSSTGIALVDSQDLSTGLFEWTEKNPPPASIMIISGPRELERLASSIYRLRNYNGYNILLAYPQHHPIPAWLWESFLCGDYKVWLWKSLLADDKDSGSADNKQVTTRLVLQDKCSETGESPWFCADCYFSGQSFEDFTTHLNSEEHNEDHADCNLGEPETYNCRQLDPKFEVDSIILDLLTLVDAKTLKKMSMKRKIEEVELGEDTEEVELGEDTEEVEVEEDTECLI